MEITRMHLWNVRLNPSDSPQIVHNCPLDGGVVNIVVNCLRKRARPVLSDKKAISFVFEMSLIVH